MIAILPQIVMLMLVGASIGMSAVRHGKERTEQDNVFITIVSALIIQAILVWGGFYDPLFK